MIERLLSCADALYARADVGIAGLPRECRYGITAARRIYAAIGAEVRRRDCNAVDGRAVVSGSRKLGLLLGCAIWSRARPSVPAIKPLAETAFLVSAAQRADSAAPAANSARASLWARPAQHVITLVELFERLERRERAARELLQTGRSA